MYLGNQPALSYTSFAKQDFTTSATTSYTLDNPVTNENEIALFINFVRQEPTTAYTASGTSLTLTSATSASDDMYCVFLGKAVQTVTPANGSVTGAMMSYPLTTFSSTGIDDNATSTAMTIDSDGNLNINTTTKLTDASISSGATGISLRGDADVGLISRDGGYGLVINRKTSDGELMEFRKDGTAFGNIGTVGGSAFYISGNNNVGLQFNNVYDEIRPCNSDGSARDNAIDLGNATRRFQDIYATNGTIQTSDQNEKQSIQSLTTAEMNVAKRLSPLIKTFKWNSAVEEKGDNARTHTGIIAQDVQQAFTDEGLDSSNYALFISGTWWEKEISVEATEEKDAYTYMDTKEEATDGYTERTRLGVRYPELLSFIQAYNDQRFTDLEARITTLENA